MRTKKFGLFGVAVAINVGGLLALVQPASATNPPACTADQMAYAQGFSDATCASQGYSGSGVSSCTQVNGSFTWNFACY